MDRMNRKLLFLTLGALALAGCEKHSASSSPGNAVTPEKIDPCSLLQNQEIETVQGSPIKETKNSVRSDGSFRVSQCFYTAKDSSRSVSLTVTQRNPDSSVKRSPREFWKETFGRSTAEVKEKEGDEEKRESLRERDEEQGPPPKKIENLGDDAYWSANRVGGALYVLKGDVFIRISLGGPDNEQTKLEKSKKLMQEALNRL
jgi:hypothetical protein